MKILHINAYKDYGSTGKLVTKLNDYCNDNGMVSRIAYSVGSKDKSNIIIGNKVEKKIHALLARVTGLQGYFSTWGTLKFIKEIEKYSPDIIHLHNLHSNFINVPMILKYISKKNLITFITLHDCWFYTDGCTHYTVDECKVWIEGSGKCTRLKKDIPSYFFDRSVKMLQDKKNAYLKIRNLHVVGVSDWITNECKISILSESKSIRTIKNWVDEEIHGQNFDKSSFNNIKNLKKKFVILGVASKWSESKGISKFDELSKSFGTEVQIMLVGNSANITKIDEIMYIDETSTIEDLQKLYSIADVLINFSLEESFGLVTAEALANGVPVITNNSTANPEMIGDKCGEVLADLEIKTVVKSVMKIMSNGKEYYSKSCISFAKDNFSERDNLHSYLNSYREATKNYE